MERREFIAAAAGATVLAASGDAFAEADMLSMHPAMFKALQEACGHCVGTANDCLRHCIGMLAMKDFSMICAPAALLQALAAVNSPQVPAFAKATLA